MEWIVDKPVEISVDDVCLEGRCFGPPPGEADTIVMLHEGLGCIALWRDFPSALAKATGQGVFCYSRQGYGGSDPIPLPRPLDYMTDEGLRVLPKVLDEIGFQRGALLGHSDGASIAAIYGGGVQDHRIRGLVLMAPHFFTEPLGLASIEDAGRLYESSDLRKRLAKYHEDVDGAFLGWKDAWLHPEFKDWDITEPLAYLRMPVLVIQGEDDQYGTRAQVDAVMDDVYSPVDVEMVSNCRHSPHIDQPEHTVEIVAEYIWRLQRIENARSDVAA